MSQIGFVILTHSKPHQTHRLVNRLNMMFDNPPIVIHHDFGKCPLSEESFPTNVSFVHPHFDTGWAEFSVVEATVKAITQMYRRSNAPDWCTVLSGACYPTKPAAQILADLTRGNYDAFINGRNVGLDTLTTDWHRERYARYCIKKIKLPSVDKRLRLKMRFMHLPHFIGRYLLPFSDSFQCFAGSQWFTVGCRAAEYIISFQDTPINKVLSNHYRKIYKFSEESYFQTILYNASDLNICFDNWLYLDWSEHKPHPKQLCLSDLAKIEASTSHFARKVDCDSDSDLLDALDRIIDSRDPAIDGHDPSHPQSAVGMASSS